MDIYTFLALEHGISRKEAKKLAYALTHGYNPPDPTIVTLDKGDYRVVEEEPTERQPNKADSPFASLIGRRFTITLRSRPGSNPQVVDIRPQASQGGKDPSRKG